jgi:methionyl-tRNA formyltransferase
MYRRSMTNKVKVLFLGSADFAIPSLELLLASAAVEVVGVVTQPDMPAGRKQELQPTLVRQMLLDRDYIGEVFTPVKLREEAEEILAKISPDLIITAAYGQIVPKSMLDFPRLGAWNLHGSLLPELRGAVPVQIAILQGLQVTGVTLQQMSVGMDEGAILDAISIDLQGDETTASLMAKLAEEGKVLLERNLNKIITQDYKLAEQDSALATYCYQKDIAKEKAEITAETSVAEAERMIRAFNPWPVAWLTLTSGQHAGKRLKIFSAGETVTPQDEPLSITASEKKLFLNLHGGALELKEIQLEGKERKSATEYLYLVLNT